MRLRAQLRRTAELNLRLRSLLSVALGLSLLTVLIAQPGPALTSKPSAPASSQFATMMNSPAGQAYARVPIYFEENQGQVDSQVKFLTRTGGSNNLSDCQRSRLCTAALELRIAGH